MFICTVHIILGSCVVECLFLLYISYWPFTLYTVFICTVHIVPGSIVLYAVFTGVACKQGCRNVTFSKTPTISVDKTESGANIRVNFKASPRTFCFCKELRERKNNNCEDYARRSLCVHIVSWW